MLDSVLQEMYQIITKNVCLTAVGLLIGSEALWKLFLKVRKHLKREGEEINKVLFFPVLKLPVGWIGKRSESRLKTSFSDFYAVISVRKKS